MLELEGPMVELLPEVPVVNPWECEDGFVWVRRIEDTPWRILENIGSWPYSAAASVKVETAAGTLWGLATYTEGDIAVQSFTKFEDLRQAEIELIEFWREG